MLGTSTHVYNTMDTRMVIAGWQPRYRLPMDMALTVAASVFYAVLWERMRSRTPQKP